MDDRTFDEQTANDWIKAVESTEKSFRDTFVYPKINELISQRSPQRVLDIGCGQGVGVDRINLANASYTGIEPSIYLLDRAQKLFSRANRSFLQGSAYSLPVPAASFDLVYSVMVWHLLEDIKKAAAELSRVLTANGIFLIVTANPDASSAWKALYQDVRLEGKRLEGTMTMGEVTSRDVLYLHSNEDFKESFEQSGLLIKQQYAFMPSKINPEVKVLTSIQGFKI